MAQVHSYDAIKALIEASRDMLTVWEGVAHPSLAYREGSPAWRIRQALEQLAPTTEGDV